MAPEALPLHAEPPTPSAQRCGAHVRVLVLDNEEIVRCGFRLLLDSQSWAERCLTTADVEGGLELARRYEPHVALVNAGALDCDPTAFARALLTVSPHTRILLLTRADAVAPSTLRVAGAIGFLSSKWAAGDLLRTIRMASVGRSVRVQPARGTTALSARQQEVLQLIADGATNDEIARLLFLSHHTVKQHTSALYRKLNARNRLHAVQTARQHGLLAA